MKLCPYCAKEIHDDDNICRWCGGDLAKKELSIWVIAIPVGLVLAALILWASASRPQTGSNAILHFITNGIIWSLITAALIALDRWLKTKGFRYLWGILIIGAVLVFLFFSTGANILGQNHGENVANDSSFSVTGATTRRHKINQ